MIFEYMHKEWCFYYFFNQRKVSGVPLGHSRLRIWCCHCRGSGCCCGMGSIPGPGTSTCHGQGQKKNRKVSVVLEGWRLWIKRDQRENFPDLQISPGAQRRPTRLKQKIGGWRCHYLEEPQAYMDVPLTIRIAMLKMKKISHNHSVTCVIREN